jgi:hypothetical protein
MEESVGNGHVVGSVIFRIETTITILLAIFEIGQCSFSIKG